MNQIKKVYISVDIEGVAGICNWKETELNHPDYSYFQEEMIQETIRCCKTLLSLGISDITVRDAHDSARNLLPNRLPKEIKLIRGWTNGPCDMMAGLDATFDGIILIGYHSPSRSNGNPLSHTLTTNLNHIKINGKVTSEFLLNTYYANLYKVPVILLAGDKSLTEQVLDQNSNIEVVATNTGLHGAIIARHPDLVLDDIEKATKAAIYKLTADKQALFIPMPRIFDTEIHYRTHAQAYRASFYPGASVLNADKTTHKSPDFMDTLKFIMFTC